MDVEIQGSLLCDKRNIASPACAFLIFSINSMLIFCSVPEKNANGLNYFLIISGASGVLSPAVIVLVATISGIHSS